MKNKIAFVPFLLAMALGITACNAKNNNGQEETTSAVVDIADIDFAQSESEMFSDRDYEVGYSESDKINIELKGDSISCTSTKVKIEGTKLTIMEEGTYVFSGSLNDGMIIVDAKETDKPQIVLNGVSINSSSNAAIYVKEADKVFVTLEKGSTNTLSNGGTFTNIDENNIDAVIFSKADITFNGLGTLKINTVAGHGISGKDDVKVTSGNYNINASSHGIDANDSVRITNAIFEIESGKDGIHVENADDSTKGFVYIASGTIKVISTGDGISAGAYMQVADGTIDILAGGGYENGETHTNQGGMPGGMPGSNPGRPGGRAIEDIEETSDDTTSTKGLKATGSILISAGNIKIDSADDAIHSDAYISINGGSFEMASGDDGIHANETLLINAGTINISKCYEGLEALNITINDGDISLVATDDGLNAAGGNDSSGFGGMGGRPDMFGTSSNAAINIAGGKLFINASGDGIDANGTLTISGGYTVVEGPTVGDTATLDYDNSAVITGGTFIGTGASGMAQTFSSSTQGVFAVTTGNCQAGTTITLTDSEGNVVVTHTPQQNFAVAIISTPEMVSGNKYKITVGEASGEFEAD
ncbi:MAG: carbohydrate-binding domain-containing protein [Lachnospiraceae bacterium]|nr:carbohydrate-binding domain-containing protein [Lachnospiraceae bacterium]